MKIEEIFYNNEDTTPSDRDIGKSSGYTVQALKDAILSDETPAVRNAGSVSNGWAWRDLQKLGWAKRGQQTVDRRAGIVEVWWEYTGPNQIKLVTRGASEPVVMSKGDSTPPVEVDYS